MRRLWEQEGQAAVEYAILAALISIAAITVMATLGNQVQDLFQSAVDVL